MTSQNELAPQALIEVRNLSFRHSDSPTEALHGIDLAINPGDKVAILGPSKSGKTTLLLALTQHLLELRSGELRGIISQPEEIAALPQGKRFGIVLQDSEAMFCNLRVWEEVAFGLEALLSDEEAIRARITIVLDAVGLAGYEQRFVYELSGGEAQKLAIACAIAPNPHLVLLDEVTESLDPRSRQAIVDYLGELQKEGKAIVFTSKEWTSWVSSADKVILLVDGKCMAVDSPTKVLQSCLPHLQEWGILPAQIHEIGLSLQRDGLWTGPIPLNSETIEGIIAKALAGRRRKEERIRQHEIQQPQSVLVNLSHLTFYYEKTKPALSDVSLSVPEGKLVAFVGRNGSGKTTLAKLVMGLLTPSEGSVLLSHSTRAGRARRFVGYVFQNPKHQFLRETVFEEVAFGARLAGKVGSAAGNRVTSILAEIGIPKEMWHESPFLLSETHQRLLALISIAVLEPTLLIVDEPTHGQDAHTRVAIEKLLGRLRQEGRTVVVISHDMRFVERIADHVYAFAQGKMLFEGTPRELFQQTQVMATAGLQSTTLSELASFARGRGAVVPVLRTPEEFSAWISGLSKPDHAN